MCVILCIAGHCNEKNTPQISKVPTRGQYGPPVRLPWVGSVSHLGAIDILGWIILSLVPGGVGGGTVLCIVGCLASSGPLLDSNSTPPHHQLGQ